MFSDRGFDVPTSGRRLGLSLADSKTLPNLANKASSDTSSNRLDGPKEKRAKPDICGHSGHEHPALLPTGPRGSQQ